MGLGLGPGVAALCDAVVGEPAQFSDFDDHQVHQVVGGDGAGESDDQAAAGPGGEDGFEFVCHGLEIESQGGSQGGADVALEFDVVAEHFEEERSDLAGEEVEGQVGEGVGDPGSCQGGDDVDTAEQCDGAGDGELEAGRDDTSDDHPQGQAPGEDVG